MRTRTSKVPTARESRPTRLHSLNRAFSFRGAGSHLSQSFDCISTPGINSRKNKGANKKDWVLSFAPENALYLCALKCAVQNMRTSMNVEPKCLSRYDCSRGRRKRDHDFVDSKGAYTYLSLGFAPHFSLLPLLLKSLLRHMSLLHHKKQSRSSMPEMSAITS